MLGRLLANLSRYGPLTRDEREAVSSLPLIVRRFGAAEDIAVEGDAPSQCRVLLDGLAFRHKTLRDGRRQILSFHVAGDICDLEGLLLPMDSSISAVGRVEVGFVPHAALSALMEARPRITLALWRMNLVEGAVFREWMVGMGRRTAHARIAHLFCELVMRMRAAGLGQGDSFPLPISQAHLSDALGLSVVHTNRVLQALRRDRLISFRSGELIVHDWAGLQAAGEFDPGYLHMRHVALGGV